ncbi:Uncharacterised protein [Mycobacteroides abscessus subsp. abscessus]|nr:Uncharacterised protein [Mycobacteroides abscessus subsp. abscessus]
MRRGTKPVAMITSPYSKVPPSLRVTVRATGSSAVTSEPRRNSICFSS